MQKHDDDNIPVLEDIIHEHENLQPDAPATNEKQKTLWDDADIAETHAAVATPDEFTDEYTWDEPVVEFDDDAPAGEMVDDSNAFQNEEPVSLLRHDEPVDTIGIMEDTAEDGFDGIETYMDDPAVDALELPADNASSLAEEIDIERLSERILLQLIPDLEDYLHDRIRHALETALKDRHRD
jgi:hypothetical protein